MKIIADKAALAGGGWSGAFKIRKPDNDKAFCSAEEFEMVQNY